jgi:diadenosine tetraphosphate (Ap4A) HIT family hydrolase
MDDRAFELDARLEADSYPLGDWPLCRVLLMDDARYPWLILVPRRAGAVEIIDLTREERVVLIEEIAQAEQALRSVVDPDKLNVGALGNVVKQLHVHVIARFVSDPAGTGPVWGVGQRKSYPPHMVGPLMDKLAKALGFRA